LGVHFDSHIEVAANKRPLQTSLQVKFQQLGLKEILSGLGAKGEASGIINGDINLEGSGRSPADFVAPADDSLWLVMKYGRIDAPLLEAVGLNIFELLALMHSGGSIATDSRCTIAGHWHAGENEPDECDKQKEQAGSDSILIRCLVADFKAQNGIRKTQTLMVDTKDTKFVGSGTVDLGSASVDFKLLPRAKELLLFAGQAPLYVQGTLRNLNRQCEQGANRIFAVDARRTGHSEVCQRPATHPSGAATIEYSV
jgi:AsmA family protein